MVLKAVGIVLNCEQAGLINNPLGSPFTEIVYSALPEESGRVCNRPGSINNQPSSRN